MTAPTNVAPDSATLLVTVAENALRRLDDVRLPLHILLENRFGDLNENQEELLSSARAAVDAIADELAAMRQIGELESGTRQLRHDRLKLKDLVGALAPMLDALAKSQGATVEIDIPPLLPPIHADGALLSGALTELLGAVIAIAPRGRIARVTVSQGDRCLRLEGHGGLPSHSTVAATAATMVIKAHGGGIQWLDDGIAIELPTS